MIDPLSVVLWAALLMPVPMYAGYCLALRDVRDGRLKRDGYRYSYLSSQAHAQRVAARQRAHRG